MTDNRPHDREVDSKGNCSKCGGTHYGSFMCPMTLSDEQITANRENQQASLPSNVKNLCKHWIAETGHLNSHAVAWQPCPWCEIERLSRELAVQKGVNDLAYIPHRALVESRDGLQKRYDKVESERDRLRADVERLSLEFQRMEGERDRMWQERDDLRAALPRAFEAGWRTAVNWSDRDDLHADIGSPAYCADRDKELAKLSGEHAPDETAGEPVPTAWMRGIRSYIPGEPDEWNADFSYGDDRPDGDGWVPLYRMPVRASSEGVPIPDQTRASTDLGSQQEPSPVAANSPSKAGENHGSG